MASVIDLLIISYQKIPTNCFFLVNYCFIHYLFELQLDSFNLFWKTLIIVIIFLFSKETNHYMHIFQKYICIYVYMFVCQKCFKLLNQVHIDIHHTLNFYQCQILYHIIFYQESEVVLLGKYLKSPWAISCQEQSLSNLLR